MAIWGRAAGASMGLSNISERVPNLDNMRTLWSFDCVLCNGFNLVWLSLLRHVQTPHLQQTSEGMASTSYTSKLGSLSFWISFGVCVHSPYHTRSGWLGEHVEEQCLSVWELSDNSERRGNSCCSPACRMLSWVFLIHSASRDADAVTMPTDAFRNGKRSRVCEEFRICNIPGEERSDCDDVLGT